MIASRIVSLWRGEIPLASVFWEYAIAWGTLLNLVGTGTALVAFLNGWVVLGLFLHFSPTLYNALMVVSVFRAAAKEHESPLANFARIGVVTWFAAMLVF